MALALTPKSPSANRMSKIHVSAMGPSTPATTSAGGARSSRRKQRCWIFRVSGVTRDVKESDLLSSVRERYTTVKRLVITPASNKVGVSRTLDSRSTDVLVEVQFTGPQPSEGPGALLCDLLCGGSVDAQPVELPRGRKKRARIDAAASEASDSDVEYAARRQAGNGGCVLRNVDEDEDEEDGAGGGRCVTAKLVTNGPGSSPVYSSESIDDPNSIRRLSRRNSGGAVAPAADLSGSPAVALFGSKAMTPSSECRTKMGACSAPLIQSQPGKPHMFPESQQHTQRTRAQTQQQQNQGQRRGIEQAWEDVVQHVTTPPGLVPIASSNSLDNGSVENDFTAQSPSHTVKNEFEPLLSTNVGGGSPWASNTSENGNNLLDTMPPPQSGVQTMSKGWPFAPGVSDGDIASGNMMDLGDVNDFFRSPEGDGSACAGGAGTPVPAASVAGSNADAGAGRCAQDGTSSRWVTDIPIDKVLVEASRKDCDFEGRLGSPSSLNIGSRSPNNLAASSNQCHLIFTGLDRAVLDLRSLMVTVHFGVDSVHKVGKVAGPIQVGANGRAFTTIHYPSMQEIWPALYSTNNIRVVEVDMVVEIRSENGDYQHIAPHLKVTYHRSPVFGEESRRGGINTSNAAISPEDGPNISYSCVDYSCGDWFAEMCQSVFRTSPTSHHALHEDSHDLMSVGH